MTVPKVLIVDDSKTMRFQAGAMLPDATQIFEAEDGIQGLRQILTLCPDLILLDCFMPRMNGWQVVSKMLTYPKVSHLPVVLITGQKKELDANAPQLFDYFIYDYFEFLGKPFEQAGLFAAIEKAVAKAQQRHPNQTLFDPKFLRQPEQFVPKPQSVSVSITSVTPDASQPTSEDKKSSPEKSSPEKSSPDKSLPVTTPIQLAPIQLDQLPFDALNLEKSKLADLRQERAKRTAPTSAKTTSPPVKTSFLNSATDNHETVSSDAPNSDPASSDSQSARNTTGLTPKAEGDVLFQLQLLQAEMRTLRQRNDVLMEEVKQLKLQVLRLQEQP